MVYVKSYKDLIVWQKAIELIKDIYSITSKFPQSELYGLVMQMRRASVSIASNIAEGSGRRSLKDYGQFYSISYGSALELETQIIIAKELKFIDNINYKKVDATLEEVLKMLHFMKRKMIQTKS